MELIDTHCHIDVEEFEADRAAVLARARAAGVSTIVVPAIHVAGMQRLIGLCVAEPMLEPALGLHPVYLDQHRPEHLRDLERWVAEGRPVAIGEVGLDYFIDDPDRERQEALFEAQVRIARDAGLPLLLHLRKSHDRALAILRRLKFPHGGIAHAFNGSEQQARQFIELGFRLGFGGVITFERSRKIRHLAATLPAEALVLETDAPDLSPARYYGERNSPEYLPLVLEAMAELRDESPEAIARVTTANAREVLGLG